MEVRSLTVGQVAENCHVLFDESSRRGAVVDPGEEPERILGLIEELGIDIEAVLVTHCHFDHIGAVAPVARATGAPVWCPEIEKPLLSDIMAFIPWPGFGPYESYEADHLLSGGERLTVAGFEVEVLFTPGHSPGHVSFSIPAERALFSGDVLFQGSIGRTDLPGGDAATLMRTLAELMQRFDDETTVYPGHMGVTSIGAERRTNPFVAQLAG